MSSTAPPQTTSPSPTDLVSSQTVPDIPTKYLIIALVLIVFVLNLVFALVYGCIIRRERRPPTPTSHQDAQILGNEQPLHEWEQQQQYEMSIIHVTGAPGQQVTIVNGNTVLEVEDDFDPWAYWATDSETTTLGSRRSGDGIGAGTDDELSMTRVPSARDTVSGVQGRRAVVE